MMNLVLPTAAALMFAGFAQAQNPYVTSLENTLGFSSWPGQGGPLKQGFAFQLSGFPALSGYTLASDDIPLTTLSLGVIRNLTLANGSQAIDLSIGVAPASTNDAHTLFLNTLLTLQLDVGATFMRGDLNGIPVGDLNFVYQGATTGNVGGYVGFMRNNVMIAITDANPDNPTTVNLYQLATAIDSMIVAMPSLTVTAFNASTPLITMFSAPSSSLQAAEGVSTTVTVAYSDPTGSSGPLSRQFIANSNLNVTDTGGPTVTVSAGSTLGTVPLELVVINAYLQFSSQSISFTVSQ
jgi:hypothetical protein